MKKSFLFLFPFLLLAAGFAPAQSITVTSPAAGDSWTIGSSHDILWTIRGAMDDEVKILLFQGEDRILEIADRVPNSGRFTWPIPGTVIPGRYIVRVRTFDSAVMDNSTEFRIAISAQPAPLPPAQSPVAIVKPNGSESIPVGDVFRVQWNTAARGATDRTVDLLLCRDGRPIGVVAENLPVMQRNFDWKVGRLLIGSAGPDVKYKMRIRVNGTTIEDDSDRSFALVAAAGAAGGTCDFGVEGATFGDETPLEHGISIPPTTERRDVESTFLVKVRWNRVVPAVSGGQHFIRAEAVLTGTGLGSSYSTPRRFSEADADASGIITIRFPFRLPWAEIPRMTRDRHIPVEFSIAFSRGDFDSDAVNNSRTLEMRVISAQATPDFVAEIVPGSIRTDVRNAIGDNKWDILNFWSKVRFKNLARNDAGGPAASIPNVLWYSRISYLDNDGSWKGVGYNMGEVTVPADGWLVIDVDRAYQHNVWIGVNAIPVNQWKPLKFEITINWQTEIPESNTANNTDRQEFEVKR